MIRLLRIARREYLAYIRTPGFWLSLLLLPVGLSTIAIAPMVMTRSAPVPRVAVVDFSGRDLSAIVTRALATRGAGGKPRAIEVAAPEAPFSGPDDASARLKPYLKGDRTLPGGGQLDGVAIIRPAGDTVAIDFWSRNVSVSGLEQTIGEAVTGQVRRARLRALGVDPNTLESVEALNPVISDFSPKAAGGRVAFKDRLPGLAGLGMGMLLWMVVLTGAGMLLNSVMEEKTSRILEVLLSSASVPQIMGGKILGVAAVTSTILAFWMCIAGVVITVRSPDVAADLIGVMASHGRWAYFALYLAGGYLMFATLYVTIGAFCETTREAQTLLGPMMIVMSVPLMFMSQAVQHPDAPLLRTLTWVPLFTPFMMAARVASDPPVWEIVATGAMMFAITGLELWVAIPAFKSGALATGRFDLKLFFTSLARRRAP
ncbi:MAG TPA: ABC transporter permease [Caulobacteraceae bacterium]|jgi:ABC-2 type transport system permease protein